MALKKILMQRKIFELEKRKKELVDHDAEIQKRRSTFDTEVAELEKAMTEITEDTPDEERSAFDTKTAELDGIGTQLQKDEKESKAAIEAVEAELETQRTALKEINDDAEQAARSPETPEMEERSMGNEINAPEQYMSSAQRVSNLLKEEEVRTWLSGVRNLGLQNRAVTGAELEVPTVVLETIRSDIGRYSKLMQHVRLIPVSGNARQNVAGEVPEAIWTEACGKMNELTFKIYAVEVDGYKVGGFIPVCNSTLKDTDGRLLNIVMDMIARSIGYAIDKAILYGTGTKMPLGIATRLAQESQPIGYPEATAEPWKDLHVTNVLNVPKGDLGGDLIANIIEASGAAIAHGVAEKFWVMNEKTRTMIIAKCIASNAAGALVAGFDKTFPAVGGVIETLEFVPDNNIFVGYGDKYLLAQREGMSIGMSEHARYTDDQTVFKGLARYDGSPIISEAFALLGIGTAPTTSVEFAVDAAN